MRAIPAIILAASIGLVGTRGWASDDCATATPITSLPFTTTVDTTGAAWDPADPGLSCGGGQDNSVWFTYTASKPVTLLIDTLGSSYETAVGVFTDGCTAVAEIGCARDSDYDDRTQLLVPVPAGTTIHIYVADYGGGGTLVLGVSRAPYDATPPTSVRAAVASGDPTPLGGGFGRFVSTAALSKTDVAFTATTHGVFVNDGGATTTIAVSGDPTPVGGTYSTLGRPVTGGAGTVAFFASVNGAAVDQGIFRHAGGVTAPLLLTGDAAPGGGTFYRFVSGMAMSPNGSLVAFLASTSLNPHREAVWIASTTGGGVVGPLLTEGDPSPCGGTIGTLGASTPTLAVNDAGVLAVYARGGTDAILRAVGLGLWIPVACEGQASPLGGTYRTIRRTVGLGNGASAPIAFISTVTLPGPDTAAVFADSPGGAYVVAALGDVATGGETIEGLSSAAVTDVTAAGDVFFVARANVGDAVFVRSTAATQPTALLREGDPCPTGGIVEALDVVVHADAPTGAAAVHLGCTTAHGIYRIPAGGGTPTAVAVATDATSAGPGFSYDDPTLHGAHTAFAGTRTAVYQVHCSPSGCAAPTVLAQPLAPAPGLPGETIATIDAELVTGQGRLVAYVAGTEGANRRNAIFAVRNGVPELVVAEGTTLPGTTTEIAVAAGDFSSAVAASVSADKRGVAFVSAISDTNDPSALAGVYLSRGSAITEIARTSQTAPNGGTYGDFRAPLVRGGTVYFGADTGGATCAIKASGSTHTDLACDGDTIATPVGTTLFSIESDVPGLASKGPIVRGTLDAGECLLATSPVGTAPVVCRGDLLPHGGTAYDFNGLKIAAARRRIVAFVSDDVSTNTGLFALGSSVRARVAITGQPTPVGGVYSVFDPRPSLFGKTASFVADVDAGGTTQQALFVAQLRR